ncbi:MAG TPA: manganese efflux pump MntP family protein [Ignavibacteriaceae bacterium]|nr:manganese efflux pump MntP family protein [Ignavibacteriaceae bacterium]HOJ17270.1 manganese efflux pump MntP family protein [Ignavibacteriaceae bacterium]HPO54459.1 manganese efflux pump MntP family protein [Ignavibacteriaceae bacterium]
MLAIALALDAFAVSLACSSSGKISDKRSVFRMSFHFGLFQAMMPVIGWSIGLGLHSVVREVDHWIAFILLLFVGGKMIFEAVRNNGKEDMINPTRGWTLIVLSIATSIDALVVGFSLALLRIHIIYPALIIGVVTALLSLIAIRIGDLFGSRFAKLMEVLGGLIIIGIGLKILLSHIL